MGLDVTAIRNARFIAAELDEDAPEYSGRRLFRIYKNDAFDRLDGKPEGWYEFGGDDDRFGFRAGSYSGYNRWREWLSLTFLGVLPEVVWRDFAIYEAAPFSTLVHFSDCEGSFGPASCERLLHDFETGAARAGVVPASKPDAQWYTDQYFRWLKAFGIGAQGGFVKLW